MHATLRFAALTSLVVSAALSGCAPQHVDPADAPELQRFATCGELRSYMQDVMLETVLNQRYGYYGWWAMEDGAADGDSDGGTRSDGPTDFTTTNVQEEGVDEIDIVKTDGNFIYTVQDRALHIVKSWPVEESEKLSTLELDGWSQGMFLNGDKVVIFEWVDSSVFGGERYWGGTRILVVDVSDRADPKVERTIDIEGWLADGRMIDGDIYAAYNHYMQLPSELWELAWDETLGLPTTDDVDWSASQEEIERQLDAKKDRARAILEPRVRRIATAMDLDEILPLWQDQVAGGADAEPDAMVACTDLYAPQGTTQYSVLTVLHLDLDDGSKAATGLLSDGWQLYASKDNLYLAQSSWWWWWGRGDDDKKTNIHKFHLDPEGAGVEYTATAQIPGWVYDQFAFSEYEGNLRVASTDFDWWWGTDSDRGDPPANNLTVLGDRQGSWDIIGTITDIAPGERIMSSRMFGDEGYIVTFRQTDPLHVLDLSNPTAPKVVGELHIPGFSSYLHPMGDHNLLSVGRDGDEDGNVFGMAIQIFDVSDPTDPKLTHKLAMDDASGWMWSEAMWDHHAFTYHRDMLTIPASKWSYDERTGEYDYFSGAIVFHATKDDLSEVGRVDHRDLVTDSECLWSKWYDWYGSEVCADGYDYWYASLRRNVYIEDNLFSVSNYGIKVNELTAPENEITRVLFWPKAD